MRGVCPLPSWQRKSNWLTRHDLCTHVQVQCMNFTWFMYTYIDFTTASLSCTKAWAAHDGHNWKYYYCCIRHCYRYTTPGNRREVNLAVCCNTSAVSVQWSALEFPGRSLLPLILARCAESIMQIWLLLQAHTVPHYTSLKNMEKIQQRHRPITVVHLRIPLWIWSSEEYRRKNRSYTAEMRADTHMARIYGSLATQVSPYLCRIAPVVFRPGL